MAAFLVPILGVMAIWNILTDWTWIGNILGVMPEEDKKDIQKRAMSIINLLNGAKSIVFDAQKDRRQLSQQEKELIKQNSALAKTEIDEMEKKYTTKFTLMKKGEVVNELKKTKANLLLQIQNMEQIAGLIPRKPVVGEVLTGTVETVIDGDTIVIRPTGLVGPKTEVMVRLVGIDAPESTTETGETSKKWLKERIENKYIKVESDPNALMDMYGRRLGVIYESGQNINVELLKAGQADFYEFEPNALVFAKQWKAAEKEATDKAKKVTKEATKISLPDVPKIQVFTGLLAQGTLGITAPFASREADLITTQEQLQDAIYNNLSSFIVALPSKIRYEIKIINSIITKDGETKRGTSQRIISGYHKNGQAKYKTITNKFAVIHLFLWTEKQTKVKLGSVTLGPVDALAFRPTATELNNFAEKLPIKISTQNIEEIKTIEIKMPEMQPPIYPPIIIPGVMPLAPATPETQPGENLYKDMTSGQIVAIPPEEVAHRARVQVTQYIPYTPPPIPTPTEPPKPQVTIPPSNNPNKCKVATIAEFFDTARRKYPKLAERSEWYEAWGFGPANLYVGTAEQNNKILAEIKRLSGC